MEARELVPRWQVPLVMKGDSLVDLHASAKNWAIPTDGPAKPGLAAQITVEPIAGCTMGAVVKGCSLANDDLDDPASWRKVYQALLDHAVLVFPNQKNLSV